MAQYIKQPSLAASVGTGFGQGLAEQLPKEIERGRLAAGLNELANKKGLTPFQQFAGLASIPGSTPDIREHGGNLLRQQALLDYLKNPNASAQPQPKNQPQNINVINEQPNEKRSVTSPEGVRAKLNPYIPPTGEQAEMEARQLHTNEPLIYPTLDSARSAVQSKIASNINRSDSEINAENLKQGVQTTAEQELAKEIDTLGASIPGSHLSSLKQDMLDEIRSGKITEREAAVKYGKQAEELSRDYDDIKAWGGPALIFNNKKDLLSSMKAKQKTFKGLGKSREYAYALVAYNDVPYPFAYSIAKPVTEQPKANDILKTLPTLKSSIEKAPGLPGLAGLGRSGIGQQKRQQETNKVIPELAKAMGKDGSPLAISYELEKKGYDPQAWKDYLIENQKRLDLTTGQIEELGKSSNSFFGILNELWLKSFSGVE